MSTDESVRAHSTGCTPSRICLLRELTEIYDCALSWRLSLTRSVLGFVDLTGSDEVDMHVVAVRGFEPIDPHFFERFRRMPVRLTVFGVVITERVPKSPATSTMIP